MALWAMTYWTLDHGGAVFSSSGQCRPDVAQVLFYWVCDRASPLSLLASLANTALTLTVWAPVYIAAATVRPDWIIIAAPSVVAHVVGLPAALFVTIRLMLVTLTLPRRIWGRAGATRPDPATEIEAAPLPEIPACPTGRPKPLVKTRATFGLRHHAK